MMENGGGEGYTSLHMLIRWLPWDCPCTMCEQPNRGSTLKSTQRKKALVPTLNLLVLIH